MKRIVAVAFFSLVFISVAFTQTTDEKAVTTAVETLRKAMIDADKATLENLSAEQLSYGHSSGLIEDKAAFVEAIVSGKSNFNTIEISDQTLKFAGDAAIVRHKFKAELVGVGGAINNVNLSVLQVWLKQKGKWKLIARQAVKI